MLALDLTGRKIVLSGATGKLGPAIARTLASAGAEMHLLYRSNSAVAVDLAEEVSGTAWQVDLNDGQACSALATQIGTPWALVLASSPGVADAEVLEGGPGFEDAWRGSVGHALYLVRAFGPSMQRQGGGRIVALSSENVEHRYRGGGAYSSSKRALEGLISTLAAELGPSGITANVVAPGWMKTSDEDDAWYLPDIPLGRRGGPEEIGNAVAWLASDLAGYVTGAWIPVNGGRATRL